MEGMRPWHLTEMEGWKKKLNWFKGKSWNGGWKDEEITERESGWDETWEAAEVRRRHKIVRYSDFSFTYMRLGLFLTKLLQSFAFVQLSMSFQTVDWS